METCNHLEKLRILAVDDELDILESIEDILDESLVDRAMDHAGASRKIKENTYDLIILDIMGVDGMALLDEAVAGQIPTVMLTAHAINPEALKLSLDKGAVSYLPKEELRNLDVFLNDLLDTMKKGGSPWKLLVKRLGHFFADRFGPDWDALEEALKKEKKPILFY